MKNATTIRLKEEDERLIAALRLALGVRSTTELIRLALRALAKQMGVTW